MPTIIGTPTITLTSLANGMLSNITPINFTPTDSSVYGALSGIDNQFGTSGNVTLSLGAATVSFPSIVNGTNIVTLGFISPSNSGAIFVDNIVTATGFTIKSTNALDSSLVYWNVR